MENYQVFNLKDNPFKEITPTLSLDSDTEWAGPLELKDKIQKVYKDTVTLYTRQIILNWGAWGGGKTFSSIYFTNKVFSNKETKVTQAYIQLPKEGSKSSIEFFTSIIDAISITKIREQIRGIVKKLDYDTAFELINNRIRSTEFSHAVLMIGDEDEDIQLLMEQYVFSGLSKTDLKKVGLPRGLQTDRDRMRFLVGILLCFIGNEKGNKGRVIIWIDEMEDLFYYSPKNYRTFSQNLRDFVDLLTEGFTLFLNFTLTEPDENTLQMLLGPALLSRINRRIRYKELSEEGALKYVKDLVEAQKINQKEYFTDEIINLILETLPDTEMIPREINKRFTAFLDFCLDNNIKTLNRTAVNKFIEHISEEM